MTVGPAREELLRVRREAARLRGRVVLQALLVLTAAGAAVFTTAAVVPTQRLLLPGSPLPLVLLVLLVALVATAGVALGVVLRRCSVPLLAAEVEASARLGCGELLGVLEMDDPGEGESTALAHLQAIRVARSLAGLSRGAMFPDTVRRIRHAGRATGVAALALVAIAVATIVSRPVPAAEAAAALANPWAIAFPPPLPPLVVEPGRTEVARGASLRVRVRAVGRREIRLGWIGEGEPPRHLALPVGAASLAVGRVGPVDTPVRFWAEDSAGSVSDTSLVVPRDPLLVTELRVDLSYPGEYGRGTEFLERPLPPLFVPAGTALTFRGRTNHPLSAASLQAEDGGPGVSFQVVDRRFSGRLIASRDRVFHWKLRPLSAAAGVRPPAPLEIKVIVDRPPVVRIVAPGADTVLGVEPVLPLVVDARDDRGLARVELVGWRTTGAGLRFDREPIAFPLPPQGRSAVVIRHRLDLRRDGLLPGDTFLFFARASDANRSNPAAQSDTFRARLATLSEQRASLAERGERLLTEVRSLAHTAQRLARESRAAARRGVESGASATSGASGTRAQAPDSDFGATAEGRRIRGEVEDLAKRLDEAVTGAAGNRDQLHAAALSDPAVDGKLAELDRLYGEIRDSGLAERIDELERALRRLDGEARRAALARLSSRLRQLGERLEQSVSLMERVGTEQALKQAQERMTELARRQRGAADTYEPTSGWGDQQDLLARNAGQIRASLDEIEARLEAMGLEVAADGTAEAAALSARARARMTAAAGGARTRGAGTDGQTPVGAEAARAAAAAVDSASQTLREAAASLSVTWKDQAIAALDRATREAVDLAAEQAGLARDLRTRAAPRSALAGRQAALRQGLANLTESLAEAGRRTALLDRRTGPAVDRAARGMDSLGAELARRPTGGGDAASTAERIAESIADLAGSLLASRRAVEGAESATGMDEALQRLGRLGRAQAALNEDTGQLLPLWLEGRSVSRRVARLAREQAEVARGLRGVGELGESPVPTDALADEADRIAGRLDRGVVDRETLSRQEQLFRRLLDAGRTLTRKDPDPSLRESVTAVAGARGPIADLPPGETAGLRFPYPGAQELADVGVGQLRLILDYFDRLNAGGGDGGSGYDTQPRGAP